MSSPKTQNKPSPKKSNSTEDKNDSIIRIVIALIGLVGVIISAYIYYRAQIDAQLVPFHITETKEAQLTQIINTVNALSVTQTSISEQISYLSTITAQPNAIQISELQGTGTVVANQVAIARTTQTVISLQMNGIPEVISLDFPGETIYVRSYPSLESSPVGVVYVGDPVIVTGYTMADWTWYQIRVPTRDVESGWISGVINIGGKTHSSIKVSDYESLRSLFINFSDIPKP